MSEISLNSRVSSTILQNESYLRHLESKNKAKQWIDLSRTRQHWWTYTDGYHPDYLIIMDITSSGNVREWQDGMKENLSTARENLENTQADTTRLILFHHTYRLVAQELFGDLYDIDPTFFRDVAYSEMEGLDLEHPFREYLTGHSPTHLHFGYSWVGKVVHYKATGDQEPRNVGKLSGIS